MDFDRLNRLLKERGISRRKLALAVGIPESTMSPAFMRRSGLSSADVIKIANYLGVDPAYLEGFDFDAAMRGLDEYVELAISAADRQFEEQVIESMRKLNTLGKTEAVKRVEELTEIPRYQRQQDNGEQKPD